MATKPGLVATVRRNPFFQSVLGLFFNKGVRGVPRVLLNLVGVLVGLFVFVKLLPSRLSESALQAIPKPKIIWPGSSHQESSGSGGLRIVVFGELDIGTPVGASRETEDSKAWTEALCDKLECNTHISMVPTPDRGSWSISSNELYAHGVERVLNETADSDGPGHDYSFVSASYPPQWESWDLKAQIDEFLAMPKGPTPLSTLWVFSFGQWDVWTLSVLPIAKGKESIDAMTRDMFEQMERLYVASMDPESIAYSVDTSPAETINATEIPEQASAEHGPEARAEVLAGERISTEELTAVETTPTEAETSGEEQPKPIGTFQIFIPAVIDPSLLPGWRDLRPETPAVHSKAEQLRNAVTLTAEWNRLIQDRMVDWVQKDNDDGDIDDNDDNDDNDDDNDDNDDNDDDDDADADADAAAAVDDKANNQDATPGPIRDGFAYNLAGFVHASILDRQLHNANLTDGNGMGQGAVDAGFRDVRNPCLQPVEGTARPASPVAAAAAAGDVRINIPNVKLDHDVQAPAKKRAEFVEMPGLAYVSTAKACNIPADHLFYTPFALSQKAVLWVAEEMADLIRDGESVRTKLGKGRSKGGLRTS